MHDTSNAPQRRVLVVAHPRRPDALAAAEVVIARLHQSNIQVAVAPAELYRHVQHHPGVLPTTIDVALDHSPAAGCELVCVLGGDGSILRGAEIARGSGAPLLGVNLGHVGFLAEAEKDDLEAVVRHIVERDYLVEERATLDVRATLDGHLLSATWALNEASVEKAARERLIELTVEIDSRPLSTWGCDGVVIATPTGSTAYAFSAGGPVVWPGVNATLVVPISAHALFTRPLVLDPATELAIEVVGDAAAHAVMWCDGNRAVDLPPGARVEIGSSAVPVKLARLTAGSFTDRLVAKFDLSIHGWRGSRSAAGAREAGTRDAT